MEAAAPLVAPTLVDSQGEPDVRRSLEEALARQDPEVLRQSLYGTFDATRTDHSRAAPWRRRDLNLETLETPVRAGSDAPLKIERTDVPELAAVVASMDDLVAQLENLKLRVKRTEIQNIAAQKRMNVFFSDIERDEARAAARQAIITGVPEAMDAEFVDRLFKRINYEKGNVKELTLVTEQDGPCRAITITCHNAARARRLVTRFREARGQAQKLHFEGQASTCFAGNSRLQQLREMPMAILAQCMRAKLNRKLKVIWGAGIAGDPDSGRILGCISFHDDEMRAIVRVHDDVYNGLKMEFETAWKAEFSKKQYTKKFSDLTKFPWMLDIVRCKLGGSLHASRPQAMDTEGRDVQYIASSNEHEGHAPGTWGPIRGTSTSAGSGTTRAVSEGPYGTAGGGTDVPFPPAVQPGMHGGSTAT